jgi:superfamily II DNA or RNA helicase
MNLRPYQNKAIEDIRHHFSRGKKRILLVAPTGSGKTVIASSMMQKAKERSKFNLFVAHRRELVMQCSRKLSDFGLNHGVIMADKSPNTIADIQVASIQTFVSRKDRDDFIKPNADILILDEAHRSVSGQFTELLKVYPNAFIIGLTATPIRNDGRGLGNIYEEIVECGSIKELTEQGYLVPNRIVAPTIPDLQKIRIVAGDYEKKALTKKMNTAKLVGDIVSHWIKYGENRATVVFATSIAHSKHIANIFRQNGVPSGHIDSEQNELERETQLANLNSGKIKVLSNCQILTEGWDQPKISCVIIARPTKSYPMYLQMVGRTLRPYPNKKDTLIIDHSGCVYEHGFPEDAGNWTLSTKKPKTRDRIKDPIQPIEKQPFTCVQCDTVYKPTKDDYACPNCALIPTKKERIVLISEGRLVEMPKTKPNANDKQNFYAQLLFYCRQKGYKEGWASHTFKQKYGHFPHNKKTFPIATGKDVMSFIQHLNIRRAKSRNMRELNV